MKEALLALERHIIKAQAELTEVMGKIAKLAEGADKPVPAPAPPRTKFDELAELLRSEDWPHAVNPSQICDVASDEDKIDRAEGILDIIIDTQLAGLKFLDFGCGEGHVVSRARLQNPELGIGYDIVQSPRWEEFASARIKFTSSWEEVVNNGPYSVILMYDVIDHILNQEPESVMRQLRPLLAPNGKIFVRCHPYCSRHGTHLYHQINKAYVHLVFSEEELEKLGYHTPHETNKVIHPLMAYNKAFTRAGFSLTGGPQVQREPVEPFFVNTPLITDRIKANWANSHEENLRKGSHFPFIQMEQQFLDYVLV